jgi:HAD superfamily hydrolase (TIGR01549 family)
MARLLIFDLDGTLTRPFLDFAAIRAAIGLGEPLLESMLALPDGPARARAFALLERFEEEAAERSELNDGAREAVDALSRRGVPAGLVTRNSRRSALRTLEKHGLRFPIVMTRDDAPPKPRPEPLLAICAHFGVPPADALMVGDFRLDVLAGRLAGTRTALLTNGRAASWLPEAPPDHVIASLRDLEGLLPPVSRDNVPAAW